MKKAKIGLIIGLTIGILLLVACFNNNDIKETDKVNNTDKTVIEPTPTNNKEMTRIEKWLENMEDKDKVILSAKQIAAYNNEIIEKAPSMVDMTKQSTSYKKADLIKDIEGSYVPKLPKYDKGKEVLASDVETIKNNYNLDAIEDVIEARFGITVLRANLKSLPTSKGFYDSETDKYYDRIQETELVTGMVLHILHTSKDSKYYYVQTHYYKGWLPVEAVAICNKTDWDKFLSPSSFVTIISPLIDIGTKGAKADMGAIYPLITEKESSYTIIIPERDSDGKLVITETDVSKTDSNKGYLDYTRGNYVTQALKYLGTPYGWGGLDDGVDCSSYVINVFRSFGFYFPRNTGQMHGVLSKASLLLKDSNKDEILTLVQDINKPTVLLKNGHVILYLGTLDGVAYVIHSPQGGQTVREEPLANVTANLLTLDVIH